MTDARQILAAAVLSVALHAAVGAALRGVRLEVPAAARESSLFVDLIEPVVATPGAALAPPPARRPPAPPAPPPAAAWVEEPPARAAAPAPTVEVPVVPALPAPPAAPPAPPRAPAPPSALPSFRLEPQAAMRPQPAGPPGALRAPGGPGDPAPPAPARVATPEPGESAGGGGATAGTSRASEAVGATAPGDGAGRAAPGAAPPALGGDGGAGPGVARATPPRGGALPPGYEPYVRAFRQRIQEHLRYPRLAVRQGLAGLVELEVRLDAGGRLTGVSVVGREAAAILRDAAIQAVRDATPFPLPPDVEARALTIRLPVVFELR